MGNGHSGEIMSSVIDRLSVRVTPNTLTGYSGMRGGLSTELGCPMLGSVNTISQSC